MNLQLDGLVHRVDGARSDRRHGLRLAVGTGELDGGRRHSRATADLNGIELPELLRLVELVAHQRQQVGVGDVLLFVGELLEARERLLE